MTETISAISARAYDGDEIRNRIMDHHRQRIEATAAMSAAQSVKHEAPALAVAEANAVAQASGSAGRPLLSAELRGLVYGPTSDPNQSRKNDANSAMIISQLVEALRAAERKPE